MLADLKRVLPLSWFRLFFIFWREWAAKSSNQGTDFEMDFDMDLDFGGGIK
jgi:hypothetical protein